ncbi:DUF1330 domain-containing protein [Streptomyces mirabilis]|uniref:DUF1330 domain-containing protein n=1 Tax=Streptomyces mirabilis TaxID=68239 RepID=UPI0036CFAE4E
MPAYLIARINHVKQNPDWGKETSEYRSRISGTLEPFGARFVVQAGSPESVEGDWNPLFLTIIEFPSADHIRRWYASDAYQDIVSLRTRNVDSDLVIVE